jgi:hypothetical protein
MTPQELSSQKEHLSTSFVGSEEDFFTDLTLETYHETISHGDPLMPSFNGIKADSTRRGG